MKTTFKINENLFKTKDGYVLTKHDDIEFHNEPYLLVIDKYEPFIWKHTLDFKYNLPVKEILAINYTVDINNLPKFKLNGNVKEITAYINGSNIELIDVIYID